MTLEALLLALSCTLVSTSSEYVSPNYVGVRIIECPKAVYSLKRFKDHAHFKEVSIAEKISITPQTYYNQVIADGVNASLTIEVLPDKVILSNRVEVDRPWIAPVPLFVGIAKGKHNDLLEQELEKLLKD